MIANQLSNILHDLANPSTQDFERLESADVSEFMRAVYEHYPIKFQDYKIGTKQELSFAKKIRYQFYPLMKLKDILTSAGIIRNCVNCLFIVIENGRITGITQIKQMTIRRERSLHPRLVIDSSAGKKVDLTIDGWTRQQVTRRTVRLSETFLRNRGWRLNRLLNKFRRR